MIATAFIVVIPARMASARLPSKPLLDIAGKPMVVRVAERALMSHASRVIVATDHPDIQAACEAANIEVMITRSDHLSGSDRLAEVVLLLGLADDAIVINVQGDEPLIDPTLIDRLAEVSAAGDAAVTTLAHPIHDVADMSNPSVVKVVVDAAGRALYFSRAPIPWSREVCYEPAKALPAALRHIGLYGYRASFLKVYMSLAPSPLEQHEALEQLRVLWHGYSIMVAIVDKAPPAGVDTPADLERVIRIFQHLR